MLGSRSRIIRHAGWAQEPSYVVLRISFVIESYVVAWLCYTRAGWLAPSHITRWLWVRLPCCSSLTATSRCSEPSSCLPTCCPRCSWSTSVAAVAARCCCLARLPRCYRCLQYHQVRYHCSWRSGLQTFKCLCWQCHSQEDGSDPSVGEKL